MKSISAYQFAGAMIVARILALALYIPSEGENPVVTALALPILALAKYALLALTIRAYEKQAFTRGAAVCSAILAGALLISICGAFSQSVETVYPDRFSRLGITAVFFIIGAYVASMGAAGTVRTAGIFLFAAAIFSAILLFQTRGSMLTDRITLYSPSPLRDLESALRNLTAYSADVFIFAMMLPYVRSSPKKAAGIYLTADLLIWLVFAMAYAAIMGRLYPRSGYSFFAIAYCTQGLLIDRADGVFFCVVSAAAIIVCALLTGILKNAVKYIFTSIRSDEKTYLAAAGVLTAAAISLSGFGIELSRYAGVLAAAVWIALAAYALTGIFSRKYRAVKNTEAEKEGD